jgi:hypothetical protein
MSKASPSLLRATLFRAAHRGTWAAGAYPGNGV